MPLLDISDLNAGYGDLQVLWELNLQVETGEIVSLIGSNGAGKTTTLKTIAGSLRPKSGILQFDGKNINRFTPHATVDEGIVYVPEGRRIFPRLTVEENLELGSYTARARNSKESSLKSVFDLFPVLKEKRQRRAGTLSGGQQQMLAIARGLMSLPRLLMLDEPSFGLAPLIVDKIYETIRAINERRMTVILVDQDAGRALEISNHGYLLESGRIVREGASGDLLKDEYVREAYLGL